MHFQYNINTLNSVNSTIRNMAYHSYKNQENVSTCNGLSAIDRRYLSASMFCTQHINRICNVMDYLANSDTASQEQVLENFEIKTLISTIINCFEETLSGCIPITFDLTFNLKDTYSILLSKTHFELLMLNILYCCIKANPGKRPAPVKISISVTENKSDIVFRIRDNNEILYIEDIAANFENSFSVSENINILSYTTMLALSWQAAQKSAYEMNSAIAYTPLKHGNRYDIRLTKQVNAPSYMVCTIRPYSPTLSLFNEFVAEFKGHLCIEEIAEV